MFYCLVLVWPPVPWCQSNKLTFCSAHSLWHEWKNGVWCLVGISDWEVKCADDVQMLEVLMFSGGCSGCVRVMCPGSVSLSCSSLHYPKSIPSPFLLAQALSSEWICRCEPSFLNTMNSSSCHPYITSFYQLCSLQTFSIIAFLFLSTISCAPNTTCHFGLIF